MERRTQRNPNPISYVKFANVAEVEEALTVIEEERFGRISPGPPGVRRVEPTKTLSATNHEGKEP
jgi:hypothetical protein